MNTYNPLHDERLVATALKVILESDIQCHSEFDFENGDWGADGEFHTTWTWSDTRDLLREWEQEAGSGTKVLYDNPDVRAATPDVSDSERLLIAQTLYTHLSEIIDGLPLEQALRLLNTP